MKIRYFRKSKGKLSPIYLSLYEGDNQELISTGQQCEAKDWNKHDRILRNEKSDAFHALERIKNAVLKCKRIMEINEEVVTPFSLKQAYLKSRIENSEKIAISDNDNRKNIVLVNNLLQQWIDNTITKYQPNTKKVVKTSITTFQAYIKKHHPKLLKGQITREILSNYSKHLDKKKLADSTHAQRMKHLTWFLAFIGVDEKIIESVERRTIKPDERNIIHLTADELRKLEAVDVSFSAEWQKAKDMFLLGCYTGLRISDLKRISPHRIVDGSIELTQMKNRTRVSIPMLSATEAILKKYGYKAPKISEQQVNESIKKVCAKALINQKIYFKSKRQRQLIEKLKPKYDLIKLHIAVKTFISLAGELWGLTPADVSAITGKDLKTVLSYYLNPNTSLAKQKMIEADNRAKMKVV